MADHNSYYQQIISSADRDHAIQTLGWYISPVIHIDSVIPVFVFVFYDDPDLVAQFMAHYAAEWKKQRDGNTSPNWVQNWGGSMPGQGNPQWYRKWDRNWYREWYEGQIGYWDREWYRKSHAAVDSAFAIGVVRFLLAYDGANQGSMSLDQFIHTLFEMHKIAGMPEDAPRWMEQGGMNPNQLMAGILSGVLLVIAIAFGIWVMMGQSETLAAGSVALGEVTIAAVMVAFVLFVVMWVLERLRN